MLSRIFTNQATKIELQLRVRLRTNELNWRKISRYVRKLSALTNLYGLKLAEGRVSFVSVCLLVGDQGYRHSNVLDESPEVFVLERVAELLCKLARWVSPWRALWHEPDKVPNNPL